MYSRSTFGGIDRSAVSTLFSTPATTVETVLNHRGVSDYVQSFQTPASLPKNVQNFVEKHMSALLEYASESSTVFSANSSIRSPQGDALEDSHLEGGSLSSPLLPASVGTARSEPLPNGETGGTSSSSSQLGAASNERPLLSGITGVTSIIRHPRNRGENSSEGSAGRMSSGSEGDDERRLIGSGPRTRFFDKMLVTTTATELLAAFVASQPSVATIRRVVPSPLSLLGSEAILNTGLASSVQRLLRAAFDADFATTTQVIRSSLTEDFVARCVKRLSQSAIVVATIIDLFGSAASPVEMMAPETDTTLFTSGWIEKGFVRHLCAYFSTAVRDLTSYSYFDFLKELLKRGFNHSAGPIVDILLSYEYFGSLVEQMLQAVDGAVETVQLDAARHSQLPRHLAGEGFAAWSYALNMLRRSLPVTETVDMYNCTGEYIAPVRLVHDHQERLVATLLSGIPNPVTKEECIPVEPLVTPCPYAGQVRFSICTLFVELVHYNTAYTDAILANSGFLEAFPRVCRAFPHHEALARLLHNFVMAIFNRRPLLGENVSDAFSRDVLLSQQVTQEVSGRSGLLSRLVGFVKDDALETLSISTFAMYALSKIAATPWCTADACSPSAHLAAAWQPFGEDAAMQTRLDAMAEPITGTAYRVRGSANVPAVVHHPTLNFATGQMSRSLSLSTSTEEAASALNDAKVDTNYHSPTASSPEAGPYAVVPFVSAPPPDDEAVSVEINMEDVHRETQALRDCGSPQLRAYPDFASMRLSFGSPDSVVGSGPTEGPVQPASVLHGEAEVTNGGQTPTDGPVAAATETPMAADGATAPESAMVPSAPVTAPPPADGTAHEQGTAVSPPPIIVRTAAEAVSSPTHPPPVRKKMPASAAHRTPTSVAEE